MNGQVLPPDAKRAEIYTQKNFTELKLLLPDGSVVSALPALVMNSLVPDQYDRIDLTYTGTNITGVIYSLDGAVISTLTLSYDLNNNLISVVRT